MKKATRDFAAWISSINGLERTTRDYERGRLSLLEYISAAQTIEAQNRAAQTTEQGKAAG